MRIGLLSDTHSHMDEAILKYLKEVDEIWHAGDIGSIDVMEQLATLNKPIYGVHGNIDHGIVKQTYPEVYQRNIEGYNYVMTHIGGYPNRYYKRAIRLIESLKDTHFFICGHSHILRVIYDKKYNFLTLNPGACGHYGIHNVRTLLRFSATKTGITKLEAIELGTRGKKDGLLKS